MSDTPPDLSELRAALTSADEEIVRLVAERMRIVRQVAKTKARSELPSFDRGREDELLERLEKRGEEHGLGSDIVRDVYAALFAASRRAQRQLRAPELEKFTIGVVGGTQGMGGFLARVFRDGGYDVEVMGLGVGRTAEELAADRDLVVVAVPIDATVGVIEAIAPKVRPGACIVDVTSLKAAPMAAMLAHAPDGVEVVGTHPMFGPHGEDLDRQKVVLCRGRGDVWFSRVKRLFEAFGAETIEAEPGEHDAQMALIQVLIHEKTMVLGSVLERLKADLGRSLQFASPIYRTELAMIGRMFSQGAELYADILTSNPDASRLSHYFEQEAAHFARAVAMGDRETVVKRFRQVSEYMKDFAAWAKRQSDAILDDVMRHG
ncbi:MAG: prephenate dehydrogenase/arogenate dehydrogenase family protein [Myxococcales bacterium]|nr:prephenate dehydrogenase/arogenate dehydrogenase family protein [Myxococcales bacterium]